MEITIQIIFVTLWLLLIYSGYRALQAKKGADDALLELLKLLGDGNTMCFKAMKDINNRLEKLERAHSPADSACNPSPEAPKTAE